MSGQWELVSLTAMLLACLSWLVSPWGIVFFPQTHSTRIVFIAWEPGVTAFLWCLLTVIWDMLWLSWLGNFFIDGAIYHLKDSTLWLRWKCSLQQILRNNINYSILKAKCINAADILCEGGIFLEAGVWVPNMPFPASVFWLPLIAHLSLCS